MDSTNIRLKKKADVLWIIDKIDLFGQLQGEEKYEEANVIFGQIEQFIISEVQLNTGQVIKIPGEYKGTPTDLLWYWLEEL